MKRLSTFLLLVFVVIALTACGNGGQAEGTGSITLPEYISLDSTDENMTFPIETEANLETIEWSSSNPSIATVNNGIVTIERSGTVTITAASGDFSDTSTLVATVNKYEGYTRIRSKTEFLMIFTNPDNFNNPNNKYVLTTDIDFNGDTIDPIGGWDQSSDIIPIDPSTQFRATLDGRGYALMNFSIVEPYKTFVSGYYFGVALIPFFYDGTVRNLNLINAHFEGSGFTGSIAGKIIGGTIENCFVQGTITASANNYGIPAGGIAGIIGNEATIRNVIIDVQVIGGYVYSGFNFGEVGNVSAISPALQDPDGEMLYTALSTMKDDADEDAALTPWIDSTRVLEENMTVFNSYQLTDDVRNTIWTISDGTIPYLIRQDGTIPSWAQPREYEEVDDGGGGRPGRPGRGGGDSE